MQSEFAEKRLLECLGRLANSAEEIVALLKRQEITDEELELIREDTEGGSDD